ncbi:hypothetical protein BCR34DRAFT_385425 [Clohesyomyces aquaticus]|uniref:Uncharacterized protein n=1 Tax=Clohesyomyces aquaticus TaxID=1231657 RepID=A0A1Y1ZFS8_9PLEO|nr:hypothetical protein BCR34DRAFT_385425 [Clohesyomyces aquaticus]
MDWVEGWEGGHIHARARTQVDTDQYTRYISFGLYITMAEGYFGVWYNVHVDVSLNSLAERDIQIQVYAPNHCLDPARRPTYTTRLDMSMSHTLSQMHFAQWRPMHDTMTLAALPRTRVPYASESNQTSCTARAMLRSGLVGKVERQRVG